LKLFRRVDGPSVYAYVSSAPTLEIDPTGQAGIKNWWQRRLPGPEMEGGVEGIVVAVGL
jgi:hypothetical protein